LLIENANKDNDLNKKKPSNHGTTLELTPWTIDRYKGKLLFFLLYHNIFTS